MILRRVFQDKSNGFYVDIGAHHPRRFSNTYFFYRNGWSGINIDPNPDAIRQFRSERPKDQNLQVGVADRTAIMKYYCFDEPALNTFDGEMVQSRLASEPFKLVETMDIRVERLDDILRRHLPSKQVIDFLSVDVEGLDLAVLRSNDWQLFRPYYVLTELLNSTLEQAISSDTYRFMKSCDYVLFAKTLNTLIFRDEKR